MTPRPVGSERVYRELLRVYPAAFRSRFADEMVQLFGDQVRDARAAGGATGAARTWLRGVGDIAVSSTAEHVRRNRPMAHSLAAPPSTFNRISGLIGVVAGVVLLAAFVMELSPALNAMRVVIFNVGVIAVIVAVHRRQASVRPSLSLATAALAVLANAWCVGMTVLATGRPDTAAGDFGFVSFLSQVAMWVANAAFAIVTLRLGVVSRWGAAAVAIGSSLALVGLDRFGLVSADSSTVWGPLALTGIALSGVGWVLLGLDLALTRRASLDGEPAVRLRD